MVLFFSGSAISRRSVKVLEPGTAVGSNPVSVVAKRFFGWLTVRGGRLLVVGRVCREYLIIVGSIPNGAGTMVLWFCSFLYVNAITLSRDGWFRSSPASLSACFNERSITVEKGSYLPILNVIGISQSTWNPQSLCW